MKINLNYKLHSLSCKYSTHSFLKLELYTTLYIILRQNKPSFNENFGVI